MSALPPAKPWWDGLSKEELDRLKEEAFTGREIRDSGFPPEYWESVKKDIKGWLSTLHQAPTWSLAMLSSQLYEDYAAWCQVNSRIPIINQVKWGQFMIEFGYPPKNYGGRRRKLCRG